MAVDWKDSTVGDVFDLLNGYAFKSADFIEQGVPVIKIKNVKAGEFSEHDLSYVSDEFLGKRGDKLVQFGDLLISMSGNRHDGSPETWVGKIAQFRKTGDYFINQRVGALRVKGGAAIDPRFASYVLSSRSYQDLFIAIATSSGGQANLSPAQILGAQFYYPHLPEQRAIAHILGTLDDKIELNRRRNETLEAMARALFQDWFVDFGPVRAKTEGHGPYLPAELWQLFPDSLNDEGKPDGWDIRPVSDFAELKGGKQLEKDKIVKSGQIPVFGGAGVMGYTEDCNADGFVIAVGRVGAYCGQFFSHRGKAWINNNASLVRQNDERLGEWLFMSLLNADVEVIKKGAAQPFVSNGDVARLPLMWPGEKIVCSFSEIVVPMLRMREEADAESASIARLRDTLLPKLISGELRIKDAERFMEERAA